MKNFAMKTIAVVLVLLAVVLVGCKPNEPQTPAFDAATLIATFDKKVETTVKLTYTTNYKVDVVRPGEEGSGGMDSFKRDVVATAVVEMDLGTDLYIKVTKTRQDKLVDATATKTEEILYKKDGKYYYQTSSSEAVEVENAAEKLASIFETATYEQIGGLTLDALLYNATDKNYELKVFGLSDTFMADELATPTYAEGANGGLKVTYKPDYVGYRTDGGWSDFPNADGNNAADIEILTNSKGQVTSMKETYNQASLVFNIMSNPPTVTITGERSFTATYGEAITKAESVEMTPSVAVYEAANNGTFVVKTCPNGQFANMSDVANGGALVMGNIICVKPTANEGYEVAKVVVNGSETTLTAPANAGGFYCFNVAPGNNTIEVTFKAAGATAQTPTAVYAAANGGTFAVTTCPMGGWTNMTEVANGGELTMGNLICVQVTPDAGYKLVKVLVNGKETPLGGQAMNGYYCYNVAEGENKIQVIFAEESKELATAEYAAADNGTFVVKTCKTNDYGNMYNVDNNGVLVVGNVICVKPTANEGYKVVSVTVNGSTTTMVDPAMAGGYYCFNVASGTNTIVVVFEAI